MIEWCWTSSAKFHPPIWALCKSTPICFKTLTPLKLILLKYVRSAFKRGSNWGVTQFKGSQSDSEPNYVLSQHRIIRKFYIIRKWNSATLKTVQHAFKIILKVSCNLNLIVFHVLKYQKIIEIKADYLRKLSNGVFYFR